MSDSELTVLGFGSGESAHQRKNLDALRVELCHTHVYADASSQNQLFDERVESERKKVISVLKDLLKIMIDGMSSGAGFSMKFFRRNYWPNVTFDPDQGLSIVSDPVFTVTKGTRLHRVSRIVLLLLRVLNTGEVVTKRDHAYMAMLQNSQSQIDDVIDDIAATCGISRISLNTISSAKGLIFGDVQYTTRSGDTVNCASGTTNILTVSTHIRQMSSPAAFVLVVEKETLFCRLVQQNVAADLNCIIVTGKGYPDLPTRRMVNQLWKFLRIPVLALVDGDPHGIEIMCVYRFGSLKCAYDGQSLACPQMRWCGFFPSDFPEYCLYMSRTELTECDQNKLRDLLAQPYFTDPRMSHLTEELLILRTGNCKYGLERFANLRPDFLARNFLPVCLSRGRFL